MAFSALSAISAVGSVRCSYGALIARWAGDFNAAASLALRGRPIRAAVQRVQLNAVRQRS